MMKFNLRRLGLTSLALLMSCHVFASGQNHCLSDDIKEHMMTDRSGSFFYYKDCQFTDDDMPALVKVFSEYPTVKSVYFSDETLTAKGFAVLAQYKGFDSAEITNSKIDAASIAAFAKNTNWKTLILSSDDLGDEVSMLAANQTIQTLDLSYNTVSVSSLKAFANNKTLKSLFLNQCDINNNGAAAISKSQSIESLVLGENHLTASGFKALVSNQKLKSLDIFGNNVGEGFSALANNKTLEELIMGGSALTAADLQRLNANKSLKSIGVFIADIGTQGMETLLQMPNVKQLNVGEVTFDENILVNLLTKPHLTFLALTECDLTSNAGKYLGGKNGLTELYVSANQLQDAGAIDIAQTQSIKILYILNNGLTDVGKQALRANKSIQELHTDIESTFINSLIPSVRVDKNARHFQ